MDVIYKNYLKSKFILEEKSDDTQKQKYIKKRDPLFPRKYILEDNNGNEVLSDCDEIYEPCGGFIRFRRENKYSFFDINNGKEFYWKYSGAWDFCEGYALVWYGNTEPKIYNFIDSREYRMFTERNLSVKMVVDYAESFSEGLALIHDSYGFGFIDKNRHEVIDCQYTSARSFKGGYAVVGDGTYYGCIDKENNMVIPCIYDFISYEEPGFFIVCKDKEWGFIDKNLKYTKFEAKLNWDYKSTFENGILRIENYGLVSLNLLYEFQYCSPTEYCFVNYKGINYVTFSGGEKYSFIGEYICGFQNHVVFKDDDSYYIYDRVNKKRIYLDTSSLNIKGKFLVTDTNTYYVGKELVDLENLDITNYTSNTKNDEDIVSYDEFNNSDRIDILIARIKSYIVFIPKYSEILKKMIDEYNKKSEEYLHKKFGSPSSFVGNKIDNPKEKLKSDLKTILMNFESNKDLFTLIDYIEDCICFLEGKQAVNKDKFINDFQTVIELCQNIGEDYKKEKIKFLIEELNEEKEKIFSYLNKKYVEKEDINFDLPYRNIKEFKSNFSKNLVVLLTDIQSKNSIARINDEIMQKQIELNNYNKAKSDHILSIKKEYDNYIDKLLLEIKQLLNKYPNFSSEINNIKIRILSCNIITLPSDYEDAENMINDNIKKLALIEHELSQMRNELSDFSTITM